MPLTIVTQSRGDGPRLAEWVTYHSRLGFEEFHIVLDGVVDDSREVLAGLDVEAKIHVHERPESGEYYDGLGYSERYQRVLAWRKANAEMLEASPLPINDSTSHRQFQNIPPVMEAVVKDRKGWVAFIDVDEFIHIPGGGSIRDLLRTAEAPRLCLMSLNVDTSGHDPSLPVLEQHSMRWSIDDLRSYEHPAWARRVKTIARYRVATPFVSVHRITKGKAQRVDPTVARLLHFRTPEQKMYPPLPYSVHDPITMPTERRRSGPRPGVTR